MRRQLERREGSLLDADGTGRSSRIFVRVAARNAHVR